MATIFCFTSTGNSLYAAKKMAKNIIGEVLPMNQPSAACHDDIIGLVFPVYFWGMPRIVGRFISQLQITNKDAYIFAVATSGGPAFGVLSWLKKQLKARGTRLRYGARLVAITNYLPEYEAKDSDAQRQKIDSAILKIAHAVKNRKSNFTWFPTVINKKAFSLCPDESSDQFFSVAPACIGCATCAKVCPVNNIVMNSGKPQFQRQCEHCLGCLHSCPAQAINWKDKTQGKARYRHSGITLNELIAFHKNTG